VAAVTLPFVVSDDVPKVFAPSRNVTVPVGVPLPGATLATIAVKVTDWPTSEGLADELTVVEVLLAATVCVTAEDVLTPSVELPPYIAVIEWVPTVNVDDEKIAMPVPEFGSVTVPIVFVPSRNVTVPVAPVGVTVAVQFTACPNTEGLGAQVSAVAVVAPAIETAILKSASDGGTPSPSSDVALNAIV